MSADRSTYRINSSSEDVKKALRDEPRQTDLPVHLCYAEQLDAVKNGEDCAQSHSDEHEGAEGPPGRRAELWEQHYNDCRCADRCYLRSQNRQHWMCYASDEAGKETDHRPVHFDPLHVLDESVVYGWYEAAPNQEHNPVRMSCQSTTRPSSAEYSQ